MAGMRRIKFIIKAAYERNLPIQHTMSEQTEHLVIQQLLLQAIVIVKPCLRSPAEIDCGRHIRLCPVDDMRQLLPVIYLLKLHQLDRRPSDNHPIKTAVPDVIKFHIKFIQMARRRIFCLMRAHFYKCDVDLKRRIGERAQQLQFRILLQWHQIQNCDVDRTDILMYRTVLIHDEYIFPLQNFSCRQVTLYFNWHSFSPVLSFLLQRF